MPERARVCPNLERHGSSKKTELLIADYFYAEEIGTNTAMRELFGNPTRENPTSYIFNTIEMTSTKVILVIGATGAQGHAVIDALLEKDAEGLPSPYSVRALTRDPTSKHAAALAARGVECVQG
jgi:hypothetical protein